MVWRTVPMLVRIASSSVDGRPIGTTCGMSSKDVCCHEVVKAPDDVMVGAVGSPRFGVE